MEGDSKRRNLHRDFGLLRANDNWYPKEYMPYSRVANTATPDLFDVSLTVSRAAGNRL